MNKLWAVRISVAVLMFAPFSVFAQTDKWTAPAKFTPPLADVAVTGTITLLCPADENRVFCTCRNTGAETMRIGDNTVTTTAGLPVGANEIFEIRTRSAVYGISETGSTSAACLTEVQ